MAVAEPGKRHAWEPPLRIEIASGTHTGVWYVCTRLADGTWTCTCPDHTLRGNPQCKHIKKARIKAGEVEDINVGDLL